MDGQLGTLLLTPFLVYGVCWILELCYSLGINSKEPPIVRSRIPFFGHVISLYRHGTDYYMQLYSQTSLPAYTLRLFTKKVYIVNSLPLVSAVHRNSRTLRVEPLVQLAAECLSGLGPDMSAAFEEHKNDQGDDLSTATLKGIAHALKPGPDAVELNLRMLSNLQDLMDEAQDFRRPQKFLSWIQHVVTQASTNAIYGPANPFMDPEAEDAFWTFENNAALLLLRIAPRLIAKKAIRAREELTQRILDYYEGGGCKQGSRLARSRMEAPLNHNLTLLDAAKLEVPFLIAVLANTAPTTFWILCHAHAHPSLLADLRAEIAEAVISEGADKSATFSIDLSILKTSCPLLLAVYHEVLRRYSVFPIVRVVTSDTFLNDTYLLKKDAYVIIPSNVINSDPSSWGSDAQSLDLYRWTRKDRPRPSVTAFHAFGGAPHICPGRHFATTEILAAVAVLLLRFDILPEGGVWTVPKQDLSVFAAVPPPKGDIRVSFKVREEWRGKWQFRMGDENLRFGLACG